MHTISEPFIKDTRFKRKVTVDFEIPMGATPIQATLDFKYLKYGCTEYFFKTEKYENGSAKWVYDEELRSNFCSSCDYSTSKITPYCPECGKYMGNIEED